MIIHDIVACQGNGVSSKLTHLRAADQTDQPLCPLGGLSLKLRCIYFLTPTNMYNKRYPKNINKTLRQGGPGTPQYIHGKNT